MTHDELTARVFSERNELDAEVQRLRLENLALSVKLEEVQAEQDALRVANLENGQRLPASPSEIVEACPHCGANVNQIHRTRGFSGLPAWWCKGCHGEYAEPAYYQRVKGSA